MRPNSSHAFSKAAASSDEKIAAFHAKGFVIVRQMFQPAEVAVMAMEADRILGLNDLRQIKNLRCRWQTHCETAECLFEAYDPVIDLSPIFARVARDPRILNIAAELYGEPAYLFKDKLIFKPPGAKGYELHQDYISWKGFPKSFLTAAIAIDSCNEANGATEVFPCVHRKGYLSPSDGEYHHCPPEAVDLATGEILEVEPGDVALFGGFVPHRSAPNRTSQWRRLLYFSYNSESDGGDRRDAHYAEFHAWLKRKYSEHGKQETYFR